MMTLSATIETREFSIKYAGFIPEIRCDIDPSGRTDLLKIIDDAETKGDITIVASQGKIEDDAILAVSREGIRVTLLNGENILIVPINMLASIGFVVENSLNIVQLKIGMKNDIFDLAIIYTKTKELALEICDYIGSCFQFVYHDSISNVQTTAYSTTRNSNEQMAGVPSISTSSSTCSRKRDEMVNEFIAIIMSVSTQVELKQFVDLITKWRNGKLKVLELCQKFLETYDPSRYYLLGRMKPILLSQITPEDLVALNKFFDANGISENAAGSTASALMTAEMSLTTGDGSASFDNISCSSGLFSASNHNKI